VGIPPETTLLFKALVVTAVCLMQSPAFRARVFHRRRSGAVPADAGDDVADARPGATTAEVSAR